MKSAGNNIYFSITSKLNTQQRHVPRIDNAMSTQLDMCAHIASSRFAIKFVFIDQPLRAQFLFSLFFSLSLSREAFSVDFTYPFAVRDAWTFGKSDRFMF